jgi:hypothetical protein
MNKLFEEKRHIIARPDSNFVSADDSWLIEALRGLPIADKCEILRGCVHPLQKKTNGKGKIRQK